MDSLDKAEPQKFHTPVEVSEVFCSAAYHTADPTRGKAVGRRGNKEEAF